MQGHCYDGASTMAGEKSGVAKAITDLEHKALYAHCYSHALNLVAQDTIKHVKTMQDTLDTTYEITKLIKKSPNVRKCSKKLLMKSIMILLISMHPDAV